jgi:hypothetical protein
MGSFLPHKITQQNIMKQTIKRVKSMETKVPGIMLMHTKSTKKNSLYHPNLKHSTILHYTNVSFPGHAKGKRLLTLLLVQYVILLRFGPEGHHTGFHLKGK